ncbi:MAG: hypothetical protein ACR2FK_02495 [Sphingomicrobium sp.]
MANLSIGRAWDETAKLLVSERRLLVPIALAFLFVPVTLNGLAAPDVQTAKPADALSAVALVALLLGLVGRLAISLLATGKQGQLVELIARAAKRLLPLVVALAIVMIPLAALFVAAGRLLPDQGADPGSVPIGQALLGLVLMIALLIMTLLAAARLLLPLVPVAAIEDGGPITLLKRSWQLSRGHFWRLLALVLLIGIAGIILLVAVQSVVGSIATLAIGKPEPWTVSRLMVAVAGGLVQSAVITVGSVLVARTYVQLSASQA